MTNPSQPLVIAHHLMWTLYGWWLPNDPRGSTSQTIRNDLVAELGTLHYGRRQVQPAGREIRTFYEQAAATLKHPLLEFAPSEFPAVAAPSALPSTLAATPVTPSPSCQITSIW